MTDTGNVELRCPACAAAAAAPAYSLSSPILPPHADRSRILKGRSPPTPSRKAWWRCSAQTPAGSGPQRRAAQVRSRAKRCVYFCIDGTLVQASLEDGAQRLRVTIGSPMKARRNPSDSSTA
jgi:hypothetical protein